MKTCKYGHETDELIRGMCRRCYRKQYYADHSETAKRYQDLRRLSLKIEKQKQEMSVMETHTEQRPVIEQAKTYMPRKIQRWTPAQIERRWKQIRMWG